MIPKGSMLLHLASRVRSERKELLVTERQHLDVLRI